MPKVKTIAQWVKGGPPLLAPLGPVTEPTLCRPITPSPSPSSPLTLHQPRIGVGAASLPFQIHHVPGKTDDCHSTVANEIELLPAPRGERGREP